MAEAWHPVVLEAEFSAEMAALLMSASGRQQLSSFVRSRDESLRAKLRKHLVALGWSVVAKRNAAMAPRLRYHMDAAASANAKKKKMKAYYDSLPLLVLEYQPEDEEECDKSLALVEEGQQQERNPNPIAEYLAARGPMANELRASAKKQLESAGWSLWMKLKSNGREELRYKAPTGRSYNSLHTACLAFSSQSLCCASKETNNKRKPTCLRNKKSTKRRRISQLIIDDDAVIKKCTTSTSSKTFESVDGTRTLIKKKTTTTSSKKKKNADQARVLRPRGPKVEQPRRSRTLLSVLFDKKILSLKDRKVTFRATRDGPPLKEGFITGDGVSCTCCNKAFTVAEFQAHSSSSKGLEEEDCWGGRLFLKDGRSLAQCLLQLRSSGDRYYRQQGPRGVRIKSKCMDMDGDSVCSMCHDGGDLLLCDHCPSTFHHECLGLPAVPEGDHWSCPSCRCAICDRSDFVAPPDDDQRTIMYCDQCEREFHVGCVTNTGAAGGDYWLCSDECSKVFHNLQALVGKPPVATDMEGVSLLVLKSTSDMPMPGDAQQHGKLCAALDVLHECFVTLLEPRTQSDLTEDIVFNRESDLRRLHFRGYYVVGLERGGELLTAATLRAYGHKVAELPLIGTRFAHRRQGLCRLLVNQVERMLAAMGVRSLVLPSVPELLHTWTGPSFGFKPMTHSDKLHIAEHTILCFQGTTMCHKLLLHH